VTTELCKSCHQPHPAESPTEFILAKDVVEANKAVKERNERLRKQRSESLALSSSSSINNSFYTNCNICQTLIVNFTSKVAESHNFYTNSTIYWLLINIDFVYSVVFDFDRICII